MTIKLKNGKYSGTLGRRSSILSRELTNSLLERVVSKTPDWRELSPPTFGGLRERRGRTDMRGPLEVLEKKD